MARLFAEFDQAAFTADSLPRATKERWQPIRGGLLNLYLFDYEEFRYASGRLILRGNNGTGKSRIMALQLPFLFDGQLSSYRVEPDADPSKRMEWNLLMGRHNDRLGYTWIEFGLCESTKGNGKTVRGTSGDHPFEHDQQRFVTLGCGLSATKGSGMRDPWFFITDERVGQDLFLQSAAGHALSKSALIEAIGDQGAVYTTAKQYRQAVDDTLFGLGRQRYEAMVDLLIQLRKPQLSRNLDEKMLARVLGEALPPPLEQMIADVAESLRGLETDRMQLDRFRSTRDGVDRFLKTYRRYAKIASRRRAAGVRQSHNRYESAGSQLRKAEREHTDATAIADTATEELSSLELASERVLSRIEALRADPKMRSVESIRLANEHAQETLCDFEAAKDDCNAANEKVERQTKALSEARANAETQLKSTSQAASDSRKLATSCDLISQHDSSFENVRITLTTTDRDSVLDHNVVRKQLEAAIASRHKASEQIRKCNSKLADAESELSHAKSQLDDAQRAVDKSIDQERLGEERRKAAVEDYIDAYRMWRKESEALSLPDVEDVSESIELWSERSEGPNPVLTALNEAKQKAQNALTHTRSRLQHRVAVLTGERNEVQELVQKLEHGFHEPPELPPNADEPQRETMAGAPFWTLVDFQPDHSAGDARSADQRARIEAALESAGFLNAWVTPDGSVLSPDRNDIVLTIGSTPDAPTGARLTQVLKPDANRDSSNRHDVTDAVIADVLKKIGYGANAGQTWIAADGSWQNGPLHGRWKKGSAQYIGHEARESHRMNRIASVQDEAQRMATELHQLDSEVEAVNARISEVDRQAEGVPGDSNLRRAAAEIAIAARQTIESRTGLTEAEQHVARGRKQVDQRREKRDLDARDLGLTDWVDQLDELHQRMNQYCLKLAALWPSIELFEVRKQEFERAVLQRDEAKEEFAADEARLHEKRTRYEKAKQRLSTLEKTIGVAAEEILRLLNDAEEEKRLLRNNEKEARESEKEASNELARTDERIKARRDSIKHGESSRKTACIAFQKLADLGLLDTASGNRLEGDDSVWSISRMVEVARRTEADLSNTNADDSAWDRVQESVTSTIQELNTALSQHAFTSTLSTEDGLYLVTVPYQGKDRPVHELRDILAEEVSHRQLILDEHEREIIENHLIGEVAAKLHEQIHEAHRLVGRMNDEIQKRPMSTGMMLKFDWKPDEDLSGGIVEVCRKLLGSTGTWSPSERAAIGGFLQQHIKDVRTAQETGTWHEHLAEALDYRRWHRFWVMRKQETGWKKLTKRTHGTGSGGEKAVALTIPQFAAAAAHYSSARPNAPRLILLDEAFVGIDPDMRGKCMELIDVFDLDFLMTSEIEWGCYPSLPGVAIYQLSTRSGVDAVFLTRWIWNGRRRVKDETPLPPAALSDERDT